MTPYGAWPSPITAASLVEGASAVGEIRSDGDDVWWSESRPSEAGRTVLVVAHRLSTLRTADRIHVLERGRVVQSGTHAELVAAAGLFRDMHRLLSESDDGAAADPSIAATVGEPWFPGR